MRHDKEDIIFEGRITFIRLPDVNIDNTKSNATPSVKNINGLVTGGAVITVTNFLYGGSGQSILLLGDGTTTIANNANIKTNTGANKLLAVNKIYRFTFIGSVWYEDA